MENKKTTEYKEDKMIAIFKKFVGDRKLNISQTIKIVAAFMYGPIFIAATVYMKMSTGMEMELFKKVLAIYGVTFIAIVHLITFLVKKLDEQLIVIAESLGILEKNDLTVAVPPQTTGLNSEIGFIGRRVNAVVDTFNATLSSARDTGESLKELSGNVLTAANDAKSRTDEIATTMDEIAEDISQQADYAEQNNEAIKGLANKLNGLKETTDMISQAANNVYTENNNGLLNIKELEAYNIKNNESSQAVSKHINELVNKIGNIEGIVQTMSGIAEQTNLLALNAAIEAARAGEMGAGFSVVAGEVKKLAEQSSRHAESIRTIVSDIQKDAALSVGVMKESEEISKEQNKAVENVIKSFNEISEATKSMEEAIEKTVISVNDIDADKNSIVENVRNTAIVTQRSAAATEEITASLREQSDLANVLVEAANSLEDISVEMGDKISIFKLQD